MPDQPEISDARGAPGLDAATGVFWFEGGPRKRGALHLTRSDVKIVTEGVARQPRSYRLQAGDGPSWRMDYTGAPEDVVADYLPAPLLATLDDGRRITILDGRLAAEPPLVTQTIRGTKILVGAHAPTGLTTFAFARVALPSAAIWRGIFSGSAPVELALGDVIGEMRATVDDNGGWVELMLDETLTETEWERRFWNRCLTLLRLWTNSALCEDRVQLRLSADGAWVDLIHVVAKEPASLNHWESLLPPEELTIDTMAKALVLFDELAPIPDVASEHMVYRVTLELAVLANASCLEGLHRGTPGGTRPFPTIKKPRPIAKAAAQAAAAAAVERGLLERKDSAPAVARLTEAFSFFTEPTFVERLEELLPPVEYVAPGLIGQDRDVWISSVKKARNLEAHRFVRTATQLKSDHNERIDDYYQLAVSTEWVLRISLLLHLGVDPELLHARLLDHGKFLFALANMDISRFAWPGSRLKEFRASRTREADSAAER